MFAVAGVSDKKVLSNWCAMTFINIFIPVIDTALILVPGMILSSMGTDVSKVLKAIMIFAMQTSVIPIRNQIVGMLGSSAGIMGGMSLGGALAMLGNAASSALGNITSSFGRAGNAIDDYRNRHGYEYGADLENDKQLHELVNKNIENSIPENGLSLKSENGIYKDDEPKEMVPVPEGIQGNVTSEKDDNNNDLFIDNDSENDNNMSINDIEESENEQFEYPNNEFADKALESAMQVNGDEDFINLHDNEFASQDDKNEEFSNVASDDMSMKNNDNENSYEELVKNQNDENDSDASSIRTNMSTSPKNIANTSESVVAGQEENTSEQSIADFNNGRMYNLKSLDKLKEQNNDLNNMIMSSQSAIDKSELNKSNFEQEIASMESMKARNLQDIAENNVLNANDKADISRLEGEISSSDVAKKYNQSVAELRNIGMEQIDIENAGMLKGYSSLAGQNGIRGTEPEHEMMQKIGFNESWSKKHDDELVSLRNDFASNNRAKTAEDRDRLAMLESAKKIHNTAVKRDTYKGKMDAWQNEVVNEIAQKNILIKSREVINAKKMAENSHYEKSISVQKGKIVKQNEIINRENSKIKGYKVQQQENNSQIKQREKYERANAQLAKEHGLPGMGRSFENAASFSKQLKMQEKMHNIKKLAGQDRDNFNKGVYDKFLTHQDKRDIQHEINEQEVLLSNLKY